MVNAYFWQAGSGAWSDPSNWGGQASPFLPASSPNGADQATITSTSGVLTVTGPGQAASLTLGGSVELSNGTFVLGGLTGNASAAVTVDPNTTVSVTGDFNAGQGSLYQISGSFFANGVATLGGDFFSLSGGASVVFGGVSNVTDVNDADDNVFSVDSLSSMEIGAANAATAGQFVIDAGRTLSGGGSISATQIIVAGALEVQAGDTQSLNGAVSGAGSLQLDAGATLVLDDAAYTTAGGISPVIQGFAIDDVIDFAGLSGGQVTGVNVVGGNTVLSFSGVDSNNNTAVSDTLTFSGTALDQLSDFKFQSDGNAGFNLTVACYRRGARIATDRGEIAIERLTIGDSVVTASGETKPIRWIGHRAIDCARHADPQKIWPVRVAAGAFGPARPSRNLWLSPGHNIVFDGALMPVNALINGKSIAQLECEWVEYWHIELDEHDIIFAEGLPAETYLDTGNRTAFVNGGAFVEAHPDFQPKHWAQTCLPLVLEGEPVVAARTLLLARLAEQGMGVTFEADAHLLVDGRQIDPVLWRDNLGENGASIWMRSGSRVWG